MKKLFFSLLVCLFFSASDAQNFFVGLDSIGSKNLTNQQKFKKLLDSSNVFYNEGEYTKSLELNIEILILAHKLNDPYFIHQGYRYLGYDYLILNDTILAMESFKKSENFARLAKNDTATALTFMDLANIYSTYQNHDKAFKYHDKSIILFGRIKDSVGLAKAHYNAVYTAMDAKNYKKAFKHIVKAKELNKFEEHASFSIGVDIFYGEYYIAIEDFKKADLYLLKAIESAKEGKLNIELENGYYYYSQSLFEQKRFKEAYEAFEIYDEYSDKNSGVYSSSDRYAISEKIQLSEYRKDIRAAKLNNELQTQIVKNKSRLNFILIIVSACFLILLIALYSTSIKRINLLKALRIKNKEYLKAKDRAEKLSKAKNQFFSTVSHELRTPLYGVIGLSTILMEDKSLKKHEKDIKSLKFSADYLLALINDVLQINKIESENLKDAKTSFNLRELIETITSSFEYMRIQNDNTIKVIVSEDIPQLVHGNSVRLSQVLMNLIGNACKFTENGVIHISATTRSIDEKSVDIEFNIEDTGIGIAKEKQETIFDEFSQVGSPNYSYQGTGLGLPIVKKLLIYSNSKIHLTSELGKGSSFSFSLTYDIPESAIGPVEITSLDVKILKGKKILIVEDNHINQIVTEKILKKNEIICTVVENGELAVQEVKKNTFDLVLMDINMPVKNGLEASKEIREFNTTLPIIALTAVEIEEMRHNIYLAGMNDIIVKPYDVTKFINTIIMNIVQVNLKDNSHLKAM